MAEVIYAPDQHNCDVELDELGNQPVGTIAQCSCGKKHIRRDDQRDGLYWQLRNVDPSHGRTHHGHTCCGEAKVGDKFPGLVARCGGPAMCGKCSHDAARLHAGVIISCH